MKYSILWNEGNRLFINILKHIVLYVILFSAVHVLYQFALNKFLYQSKYLSIFISVYNVLAYPALIIFLLHFIEASINKKKLLDINEIFSKAKSYYVPIFMFNACIYFISINLNGMSRLMLLMILYTKFPFVEALIIFERKNLWSAIKESYYLTQDKLLLYLFMLLFGFTIVFLLFVRSVSGLNLELSEYEQAYVLFSNTLRVIFLFVAKIYLISLYHNVKNYPSLHC